MATATFTKQQHAITTGVDCMTVFFTHKNEKHSKVFTQPQPATYRDLQRLAKSWGLRANGDIDTLRIRVWRSEFAPYELNDSDIVGSYDSEPVELESLRKDATPVERSVKPSKPERKVKASRVQPKRDVCGMSYREAQRFVSWAKDNVVGYVAPQRNTGWDNVAENVMAVLDNEHFNTVKKTRKSVRNFLLSVNFTA